MDKDKLELRGRVFRTKADYARAWHDNRTIEHIEANLDKTNPEQVSAIRLALENGKYSFDSILGDDFVEEIIDLDEEFRRHPPVIEPEKKVKTKAIKDKPHAKAKVKDEPKKTLDDYDAVMRDQIVRQMKRNQRKRSLMLFVLGLCILGSVGYLIFYFALYEKNDAEYNELASLVKQDSGGTVEINYEEAKDKPPVLKKYETLYQKNRKIVGWLTIENCGIDYPVMQTVDNDYYLTHNYNQDYDKNGSLFMDKDCDPAFPNDNMIIYGHHMKSGKMFGNLNYYAKESFWEENKEFSFDTIYETGKYAVMYVFRSKIYSEEEIVFKYYQFIDATSADEFYSNMDEMAAMSLYDTGVSANYGDKLLTLSTCDSSEADGRFVVVAKKIK